MEQVWAGGFGDEYAVRNDVSFKYRRPFWSGILELTDPKRVLEIGCNIGGNLQFLRSRLREVWGLDIKAGALRVAQERDPDVKTVLGRARALPFDDDYFDLVISAGVLIHQPDDALNDVMTEMVRCSNRFVLAAEYHAHETTEVRYRGVLGRYHLVAIRRGSC